APQTGLGLESAQFDTAALDAHFDAFIGKLLQAVGPRPADRKSGWTMLHIDSWEMGSQNWTAGFSQEFTRRRGYDPLPYLPAMTGRVVESVEISERFLWDLRITAQELVIENHAGHLKELGRRHGFGLSIEPYDMNPTSDMTLGGVADVPMCEFWSKGFGFNSAFTCIESTSVGHTLGRPIIAAEAFTSGAKEAWQLYPANMKNQGDWAFATGINRIVFHRFAHQPWPDRRPGMTMGPYGVHWDRTQTWWPMVSEYHRYIARCQFLLRQGTNVADICYLVPEGAPHVFRPPASALAGELLDRRGYNFDGCAPDTLLEKARVKEGRIVFPGGASYRLLVLPAFDTMTPALLRKITELVKSGATVIGPPPRKSPSLSEYPQCDQEVQSLATALWGDTKPPTHVVERTLGQGRVLWGGDLQVATPGEPYTPEIAPVHWMLYPEYEATADVLAGMDLPPDFEADGPIRYTHRRTEEYDLYFVANQTAELVDATCTFRTMGRAPELWNPVTGAIQDLSEFSQKEGRTSVSIRFEPHQSFFVVFRKKSTRDTLPKSMYPDFPLLKNVAELAGPWKVSFDETLGGPKNARFETLSDWSKHPDPGIKYYAGMATYDKTFDLPVAAQADGESILLDLGEVHSMARVRLNGHDLGILWCAPWRVDITQVVQAKGNRLEIEVANLWSNRLIGDSALPEEERITWTTWSPYQPDSPLLPSGLLGPVTIMASK
ncbi:MAG: glycosyl hydrolase, partial [Candidatus Hydrogenedentes bacterium]|nr:glycosyl hydrolase [Candidatus Hydrogenedentota bacterium]